ncbi:hypothetical protein B0H13DRAFT_2344166 [Mycena leptocephala]|nr:hypothetical protein B0H13DRAFT_2344166 [Mycena leptocephala]
MSTKTVIGSLWASNQKRVGASAPIPPLTVHHYVYKAPPGLPLAVHYVVTGVGAKTRRCERRSRRPLSTTISYEAPPGLPLPVHHVVTGVGAKTRRCERRSRRPLSTPISYEALPGLLLAVHRVVAGVGAKTRGSERADPAAHCPPLSKAHIPLLIGNTNLTTILIGVSFLPNVVPPTSPNAELAAFFRAASARSGERHQQRKGMSVPVQPNAHEAHTHLQVPIRKIHLPPLSYPAAYGMHAHATTLVGGVCR